MSFPEGAFRARWRKMQRCTEGMWCLLLHVMGSVLSREPISQPALGWGAAQINFVLGWEAIRHVPSWARVFLKIKSTAGVFNCRFHQTPEPLKALPRRGLLGGHVSPNTSYSRCNWCSGKVGSYASLNNYCWLLVGLFVGYRLTSSSLVELFVILSQARRVTHPFQACLLELLKNPGKHVERCQTRYTS